MVLPLRRERARDVPTTPDFPTLRQRESRSQEWPHRMPWPNPLANTAERPVGRPPGHCPPHRLDESWRCPEIMCGGHDSPCHATTAPQSRSERARRCCLPSVDQSSSSRAGRTVGTRSANARGKWRTGEARQEVIGAATRLGDSAEFASRKDAGCHGFGFEGAAPVL